MEFTIGLLITGSFILIVTLYRLRNVRQHRGLQHQIQEAYDVSSLDVSGNTRYASCYSHTWVMDNITRKSHSRIGAMLQDHLANNTLLAGMWIGLIVGTSSMLLTLLLVQSLRTIGTVIVIFVVGALIALGPGGPRYSENLLDAVVKNQIEDLNAQDFVYVKIANDTIQRAVIVNVVLASVFIIIAPWGDMLPTLLAQGIAIFTVNLIWEPAFFLLNVHIAFALFYIAAIIGFSSFVCLKLGQRLTSQEEEAPTVHY
ncbi:MAG: hypothetical protein KGD60_00940 [Candidatus Thorarchaeota archaeon]|nr:hypothetical protein [Candidatus Thorarchaeota archaeon]